jgi:hypothetical protein
MRQLRLASFAMTGLGILAMILATVFDLGAAVLLGGLLLTWAGIVKIVVVYIWTHIAGLGTDRHHPIPPV